MRRILLMTAALAPMGTPALAAIGEQWILPIHHRDGGGWVEYPGAGYGGSSAWQGSGWDGVRRAYWQLSGTGSLGNPVPTTPELYPIEFWAPTSGGTNWQPIESQIKGVDGETYPMEPLIPWNGAYGTNHQWIGADGYNDGAWHAAGPGPHTPESDAPDAGPDGIYMWLGREGSSSWLYAKWDFGWSITRVWSALRLTQITSAGACCLPDGRCQDDLPADRCAASSGTHQGRNTMCNQIECLEATGACCPPNQSTCVEVTGTACASLGGTFHGYNTACAEKWPACCHDPFADVDDDADVDQADFAVFQACYTGVGGTADAATCGCMSIDGNLAIDADDYAAFEACTSGPGVTADAACDGLPASPP